MKTLTEFSTLTLRKAAAARAAAGGANAGAPAAELDDAMDASEEAGDAPAGDAPAGDAPGGDAPGDAADAAEATSEGVAEASAPAEPVADTPVEHKPDPIIDAIAAALSVQPDRAARLIEALDIVGNRIDEVRLVRVFQGEKGPHGSIARGEYHYAIDRVASAKRRGRDDRRSGGRGGDRDRGGGGGGGGRGGFGGPGGDRRDKPRGLGSLKVGAQKDEPKDDDRPGRGEMPRAGIGWQLTAAPRDFGGEGRGGPRRGHGPGGPGGPRGPGRGPGGRGPGGPRGPGGERGPGGDRGERRDRGPRFGGHGGPGEQRFEPRLGPDGQPLPPREPRGPLPPREPRPPQEPRLGPDGQPLPPRPRRERRPIGPDANGLGPDGQPWDPDRRAKRLAERESMRQTMNAGQVGSVDAQPTPAHGEAVEAPKE